MMRRLGLSLWSGALLLTVVGVATAQRRPPVSPPPPEPLPADVAPRVDGKPAEIEAPAGGLRDPTRPSAKMKDVLNTKTGPAGKVTLFLLRGRVIARGQPAAAVLEVDGKLYTIGKGSMVVGANNTLFRVLDIDAKGIRLESSLSKEVFVVR